MKKITFLILLFSLFFPKSSFAKASFTDESLVQKLNEGNGAIIVALNQYKLTKKARGRKISEFSSLDQILSDLAEKTNLSDDLYLYYLEAGEKSRERIFKNYFNPDFFILISKPGDIKISTLASVKGIVTSSFRIFRDTTIEAGKLKYIGEIDHVDARKLFGGRFPHPIVKANFKPDEFTQSFQKEYPKASAYLSAENILAATTAELSK